MSTCIRIETHIIKNNQKLDDLTFCSKNLYNQANYLVRNKFFETSKQKKEGLINNVIYLSYNDLYKLMRNSENYDEYKSIPEQTKQSLLRIIDKNWKSFFKSIKNWTKNKSKYKRKPNPPKYLNKQGRNILIYPGQNINVKNGKIKIPKTQIEIKTDISKESLKEIRIVPKGNKNFKIEVVYEKKIKKIEVNKHNVIGVDVGLNNLMAVTSNQTKGLCCLINGRPLKSINQFYNKKQSKLKSILKIVNDKHSSRNLIKLNCKRKNKINDYLHKASRILINLCVEFNVGKIIIGHNKGWKQNIKIGKKNNQNFVHIPFDNLIKFIEYKSEELGIKTMVIEESYTSKIDHLVLEEMKCQEKYLGKRVKRGLFKSSCGVELNADINGTLGILRKAKEVSNEFLQALGNRGCVLQPVKLSC